MSIFERIGNLFEGRSKTTASSKQSREDFSADSVTNLPDHEVYKVINSVRDLQSSYKQLYQEYDAMSEDSIIGGALELYADDASQVDGDTGRVIDIKCEDKSLREDLLTFLDSLNVESSIWGWAYDTAKYGDKFLKLVRDEKTNAIIRLDEVDDPSLILDLSNKGVRVNYAEEVPDDCRTAKMKANQKEYIFYGPDEYVHIMTKSVSKKDKLRVEVMKEGSKEYDIVEYRVLRGKSIIEGARGIYRILRLLEDSMLGARVAKAEFFRIYNVEVGANSTPQETRRTISKVKNLFDSKGRIDINKGTYVSSKTPRPIGDPIFNPVKDGKGSIQTETVGGDIEVKSLVDIDYFTNKLFAALKTPKSYLGFEESLPGGLGDDTLMLLDIRYGKTVCRVTNALRRGIVDLCNIWLRANGRTEDCDKFTVSMITPSSSEELSRLKELELRLEFVSKVSSMTDGFSEYVDSPSLLEKLIEVLVDYPELSDAVVEELRHASQRRAEALSAKDRME